MRSDKLIPLDRPELPSRDTRQAEHDEIARQVEEYLARGGQIHHPASEENFNHCWHVRRNRTQTLDLQRRLQAIFRGRR